MNCFVGDLIKKTFASTLIVVMLAMIANSSIYIHSHKLENGTIVTHSHPYDKSEDNGPFKSHQHSKAEFLFYKSLKTFFFLFFLAIVFSFLINGKAFYAVGEKEYNKLLTFSFNGRAPPAY